MARWLPFLPPFALGASTLAAQAFLFRVFLASFETSEIAIGCFFGGWLLWTAAGAGLARLYAAGRGEAAAARFPAWLLLLPAAAVLQAEWVGAARAIWGVARYEVFPPDLLALAGFVANAPTGLLGGFLFVLACGWAREETALPVARIYALETAGAGVAGVLWTLLLVAGFRMEAILAAGMSLLLPAAAAGLGGWSPRRRICMAAAGGVLLLPMFFAGRGWGSYRDRAAWNRLLPDGAYRTSFATPQARYLVGERGGGLAVLAHGTVAESLGNPDQARETAAVCLVQQPRARRVLVVGGGALELCGALAGLPAIERVVWLHPDPSFPRQLRSRLLPEERRAFAAVESPAIEMRAFLATEIGAGRRFDLVLLHLPAVTTLAAARESTLETLLLVRAALASGGVVGWRVPGGANALDPAAALFGAAARETLRSVLPGSYAVCPGESTWLFASTGGICTDAAAVVAARWSRRPGAAAAYPAEAVGARYARPRIDQQERAYERMRLAYGEAGLLHRDDRPRALLFGLLVALRRHGWDLTGERLRGLLDVGPWILPLAAALYAALRLLYLLRERSQRWLPPGMTDSSNWRTDGVALLFTAGAVGMAFSVTLMARYQYEHGALFLHIGLLTAFFMLGACLASLLLGRWLGDRTAHPTWVLPALLLLHAALLGALAYTAKGLSPTVFAFLFAAGGALTGAYAPLVAHRDRLAGIKATGSGMRVETADHLGAATGATATGLLLLPFFGASYTLGVLPVALLANMPPALYPQWRLRGRWSKDARIEAWVRGAGYWMLGIGTGALVLSRLTMATPPPAEASPPATAATAPEAPPPAAVEGLLAAARRMAPGLPVRLERVRREGKADWAYAVLGAEKTEGYVFGSEGWVEAAGGFGGPVDLWMHVDPAGRLIDLEIASSRETQAYLEAVRPWMKTLRGRDITRPEEIGKVDILSSATFTSRAVRRTLARAGERFGAEILARIGGALSARESGAEKTHATPFREETAGEAAAWKTSAGAAVVLALLLASALFLHFRPTRTRRRIHLFLVLALLGLWLNRQYSTFEIFSLFRLEGSAFLAGLMVLAVPAAVLVFGNLYCGYLCPFGALQELVGELRPVRWPVDPAKSAMRPGRGAKYVLLFLLVLAFAGTRDFAWLGADPLQYAFLEIRRGGVPLGVGLLLGLAFVYRRFWCRNLCPTGAFLSLVGAVRPLRRWMPRVRPGACDLGVRHVRELDCIRCDRCRDHAHS